MLPCWWWWWRDDDVDDEDDDDDDYDDDDDDDYDDDRKTNRMAVMQSCLWLPTEFYSKVRFEIALEIDHAAWLWWPLGLGEIGLVGLRFKIKTRPLEIGQEI